LATFGLALLFLLFITGVRRRWNALQTEVLHYIEFLIEKQAKNSTQEKPTKKRRVAGTMKGMFVLPLPDDFDEPLEDMKEYME
ncbi:MULTISPECIES: type II toxin-antitoxin system VapB family antitoxin, partial [unclassified Microcoleus]|uniref:type II toxin-antitoxin system VapB family antitoxin n=1 Tax=unclassified Microcoleus TaxID=2642155 RepID=UPI002FD69F0B